MLGGTPYGHTHPLSRRATVKRNLANVYAKIGVGSRSEAVRMALMEQWIGLNEITSAHSNGSGD